MKNFRYVVLGLFGIMGVLSMGVVNAATTITYYTGSNISYTLNGNELFTGVGTITITNGIDTITILDRNLGATTAGIGCQGTECESGDPAYGYLFQWGNNYGFPGTGSLPYSMLDNRLVDSNLVSGNYLSGVFHYSDYYGNWINDNNKVDMRGGSNADNTYDVNDNTWKVNNATGRQGPCPNGFHIPSIGELNKLIKMTGKNAQNVRNYLQIPFAGFRDRRNNPEPGWLAGLGSIFHIWSSSPATDDESKSRKMGQDSWGDFIEMKGAYRNFAYSIRCFYNEYTELPKTITYDLNGGYWVEDGSTEAKEVQFITDLNGMVPTTDWKTPSRGDECNENGVMKKCMFDGWYLGTGANAPRWTGYAISDMVVYAKWLPFEDLIITTGGVTFTIMDRNLGAIVSGTGCSNANPCGYHFQWGNNYGFKPNTGGTQTFPNKEYSTGTRSTDWESHVSTYYNGIWIDSDPRNEGYQGDDNLWGGSKASNSDEDKQGPCPYGYHVPDTLEWKAAGAALKAGQNGDIVRNMLNLPYAGLRAPGSHYVGRLGTEGRYWASTSSDENAKFLYFAKTYVYWQYDSSRSIARAVRCFENSPIRLLTFNYNGGNTTYLDQPTQTIRWRETPIDLSTASDTTRENSIFEGWYTDLSDETTKVTTNNLTGNDDVITLYAKWSCESGYVESDSGTGCIELYTIIYELNGGTNNENNVTGYTVETETITLTDPTKEGYNFNGWYLDIEFTNQITEIIKGSAGDVILYAKWTEIETKPSGGSSGGGGGGSSATPKDGQKPTEASEQVPQNDSNTKDSSADKSASEGQNNAQKGGTYSTEFQEAYEFAHDKGITTMSTIQKADMNGKLTRIAMAKMLSQYAINVLGRTPDINQNNKFNDVTEKMDSDYDDGVTLAYQLGIMGQNMPGNKFRPNDEVTRAEFATALSRMLYNTSDGEYKSTPKYYIHHMEKLIKEGIVTKDDPSMKELRGYVMIMLMRSAK